MERLAGLLILALIVYYFVFYYLHKRDDKKINALIKAGYEVRQIDIPANGMTSDTEYEFFINENWLDLKTAYKLFINDPSQK